MPQERTINISSSFVLAEKTGKFIWLWNLEGKN